MPVADRRVDKFDSGQTHLQSLSNDRFTTKDLAIINGSYFVLLCLKTFSICANHAAKAVSFSVLALRAANNAVMMLRPF